MNEKILVKLVDAKTEMQIACFWTTNWSEVFKMYHYMAENKVQTDISVADCDLAEEYKDTMFFVDDVAVQFGSKNGLNVIEVYVES